ncbi:MAG: hypothetical protein PHQ98_01425 [Candidatus ainarchaeum sp.]|nr:hypothetical protein [Candidatus ainarchaeum sp.]
MNFNKRKTSTILIILAFLLPVITFGLIKIFFTTESSENLLFNLIPIFIFIILIITIIIINKVDLVNNKSENKKQNLTKLVNLDSMSLSDKKREIDEKLKISESKFLKRQIDEKTYSEISNEANKELIEIESELKLKNNEFKLNKEIEKLNYLPKNELDNAIKLLKEKAKKINESKIAQEKYLKRKLNEENYNKLNSNIKKSIIDIESKLTVIKKNNEIYKTKSELKQNTKEIIRDLKKTKLDKEKDLEEDIFFQMGIKNK